MMTNKEKIKLGVEVGGFGLVSTCLVLSVWSYSIAWLGVGLTIVIVFVATVCDEE